MSIVHHSFTQLQKNNTMLLNHVLLGHILLLTNEISNLQHRKQCLYEPMDVFSTLKFVGATTLKLMVTDSCSEAFIIIFTSFTLCK